MSEMLKGAYSDWLKAVREAQARCEQWGDTPPSPLVLSVQARRMRQDCDWLLFALAPDPSDVYRYYACVDGTHVLLCCTTDAAPTLILPVDAHGRVVRGGPWIGGSGPQAEGTCRALLRHLLGADSLAEPLVSGLVRSCSNHSGHGNWYRAADDLLDWCVSQTRLADPAPRGQSGGGVARTEDEAPF